MPLISHYQSTLLPMQLDQYLSDIAAGDHRAFILLYDAVSAPLYGLQLRILKDPQLAQEALTDTFLTIWNDAKSFNPRHGTPMVWLNIQARKQALATQDSAGLHDSTSISFPELTPDAWLHTAREYWDTESADEFEQLLIRLETLDVDAQACIVNLYCDGYTLEELSQVLGASPDTVKSWVREGLANLQLVAETGVDETEWNLEAAEYVLGTHTEENDRVYDALYKVDADWQHRVQSWRAELNPLHASTMPVYPPDELIDTILDEVEATSGRFDAPKDASSSDTLTDTFVNGSENTVTVGSYQSATAAKELAIVPVQANNYYPEPATKPVPSSGYWREKARYWQLCTLVALVSLVGLAFVAPAYINRHSTAQSDIRTIGVLQNDASEPLWVVNLAPPSPLSFFDNDSPEVVTVTAVGDSASLADDQSHQLWMGSVDTDVLLPVGLLPEETGETATMELPANMVDAIEFVVSLEDQAGATGPDYGPIVTRSSILQIPASTD